MNTMKHDYRRRHDFGHMPLEVQLGILQTELEEYAETNEEKANAAASTARLTQTIERLTPRPPSARSDQQ